VFVSQAQRATFKSVGLPIERTFVKANLIPSIPPMAAPAIREPLVAYLGRLDEAKGILFLMDAWDRFQKVVPDGRLQLIIAGGGPLEAQVTQWAASRPSVSAVGIVSAQECSEILARSRAVLLPSQCEETFGLVVVEAMAAGAPPVAARQGPFPELISDGSDGVLFDPRDAASLVSILTDIEANPRRYERFGETARETYQGRFDPTENIKSLVAIYEFAIENPVFARASR
jgi:glycosyltransferase involved in cell wall biosynthesis